MFQSYKENNIEEQFIKRVILSGSVSAVLFVGGTRLQPINASQPHLFCAIFSLWPKQYLEMNLPYTSPQPLLWEPLL